MLGWRWGKGGEALRINEYRKITQEIFRLLEEGVHVLDGEGRTVIYNEAMAHMEKMDRKDVLHKPFREVFTSLEEQDSTLLQALEKGKTTDRIEQTYRNKDGKRITTLNSSHPVTENGRIIGAIEVARNITDLQKLAQTLMKLQEDAPEPDAVQPHTIRRYTFAGILGENTRFLDVVDRAKKAAAGSASVLLYGETGTGKELLAQSIHYGGSRSDKPFLAQNCAALPENLLEGILFGTAKGGFTGALDRAGLFEQADGGTLLLDEVSAMPYELQGKLLRVLQEDYIRRVGGTRDIPIDVRIIATINEPAEQLIQRGQLRKDLYYRLNVISLSIPPLRERRDDILLLAERFLDKHNRRNGKEVWMLADSAKQKLLDHDYPGNVRELENIIMAGVSMVENEHVLEADHLRIERPSDRTLLGLEQVEKQGLPAYLESLESGLIREALAVNGGNVSRAAVQLGIRRQTLQHKMKRL